MSVTALETALLGLVRAAVPAGTAVLLGEELSAIEERSQPTPAVHLVYAGYRVTETNASRRVARLTHTWYMVACTRSASTRGSAQGARASALALSWQLTQALMGTSATPAPAAHPLRLVTPPPPVYAAGFCYVPVAFELDGVITAP